MPDLPNRGDHEQEMMAAIVAVFHECLRQSSAAGLISRFQASVAASLANTFADAARNLAGGQKWQVSEDQVREASREWADRYVAALAREVEGTSQEWLSSGRDPEVVFSAERVRNISITETTRAISAGERWMWAFAALYLLKPETQVIRIWRTAKNDKVCAVCRPLDGKPEEVWRHMFPLGSPAHGHCQCWIDYETVES